MYTVRYFSSSSCGTPIALEPRVERECGDVPLDPLSDNGEWLGESPLLGGFDHPLVEKDDTPPPRLLRPPAEAASSRAMGNMVGYAGERRSESCEWWMHCVANGETPLACPTSVCRRWLPRALESPPLCGVRRSCFVLHPDDDDDDDGARGERKEEREEWGG